MSFVGNALNNLAFARINTVVFTSNGTYTPPNNLLYAQVIAVGGGGGSGGRDATNSSENAIGCGGGGGGAAIKTFSRADLLPDVSVTVGSGGSAGPASANFGGNGGNSTFATSIPLAGNGGGGGRGRVGNNFPIGTSGTGFTTPNGGSASGGDLNIPGGPCGFSEGLSRTSGGTQVAAVLGSPGNSILSNVTGTGPRNAESIIPGGVYGGGAPTCWNGGGSQSARVGNPGGDGVVIVFEYLGIEP